MDMVIIATLLAFLPGVIVLGVVCLSLLANTAEPKTHNERRRREILALKRAGWTQSEITKDTTNDPR